MLPPEARRILAPFAFHGPTALAVPLSWKIASDAAVLRVVHAALQEGWLTERPDGLLWTERNSQQELLSSLDSSDWLDCLLRTGLVESGLLGAREAWQSGDRALASMRYRALASGLSHDASPRGKVRWLDVVLGALQLLPREGTWLTPEVQAEALRVAEELQLPGAQAILLATRAYEEVRVGESGNAESLCRRALEIAMHVDDSSVRSHVHLHAGATCLALGRHSEAISMLESYLGDVPRQESPEVPGSAQSTTEATIATLALAYAWTGHAERGTALLEHLVQAARNRGDAAAEKLGLIYLAVISAESRDLGAARKHGEAALPLLRGEDETSSILWFLAVSLAWVRIRLGDRRAARDLLERGQAARVASGYVHVTGSALFDVLDELEREGLEVRGLSLREEARHAAAGVNPRTAGIGCRVEAMVAMRRAPSAERDGCILDSLGRSESLLRESGSIPELVVTLQLASEWFESAGRSDDASRARAELESLRRLADSEGASLDLARRDRLYRAILDLGRLTSLRTRRDGFWGEVLSRLCIGLGVQRAAIVDTTAEPRVLASRGADPAWTARAVREIGLTAGRAVEIPALDGEAVGQLLVPFQVEGAARRGWLCLENRGCCAHPDDASVMEAMSVQMGVLLDNYTLWEELTETRERLERENRYYRRASLAAPGEGSNHPVSATGMIVASPAMRETMGLVHRVAPSSTTVLILGETGVGKELIARELHRASTRKHEPFIVVHVAALAPGLVSSELFGHERGAFTGATEQVRGRFELADRGTLFLDEVAELGAEDQVRLLRVLQEGTFERVGGKKTLRSDFRLIAATNRDLRALVAEGKFREDLYYRLDVFPIRILPLRERVEDIPALAHLFLERYSRRLGRAFEGIGEADVDRLCRYGWPGNVRELEHTIERAVLVSDPPMLKIPVLDGTRHRSVAPEGWVSLEECERAYVRKVLLHTRGKITGADGAAALLGVKPTTLHFRIDKLGLRGAVDDARRKS